MSIHFKILLIRSCENWSFSFVGLNPLLSTPSAKLVFSLLRYLGIGGLVFFVDVGTFQWLILHQAYVFLAASISYSLAVVCHFTLNKFLNFRNFERSTARQFRTYLVVVAFCWLVTLVVVESGVRLGLAPLTAKLIAVGLNIPLGFLGHRYLTFGSGIRKAWHRWRRSR
ncbi:GtrA family protein [Phormidium tenue FACHB-886]|nr:GtrA family protein [Phormidium tenue FACHB-886]